MRYGLTISVALAAIAAAMAIHAGTGQLSTQARPSWPGDSIHHIDVGIETSDGRRTSLAATGGRVRLVTMFYARCPMACPLTIDTLRSIDRELPAAQRANLRVLLLTLDPEVDTPAALRALAAERRIDETRWMLGRTSASDTRELAAALAIQYRRLENGEFNHASVIVLLSADGRVLARTSRMGKPDPAFVALVRSSLGGATRRTELTQVKVSRNGARHTGS